jgi:hypothetical protein
VVCPWPGIAEAGIRWCRVGAGATPLSNWPDIEQKAGVWDWSAADGELKNLDDPLGLSLLPILGYTPRWASREPDSAETFAPPRDLRHFGRFVRACVGRYRHRVKVWEVWNEPNIGFFRGSVAEYAEMVKTAAVAARQADPQCRIALGCAGVDVDFLKRLYEYGCGPFFDVMSVHPYQWGKEFNDGWMIQKLEACRRLMDEHGDRGKEIWITEIGWSLGEGISPTEQANLLAQALVTALSVRERLKVEKVFWFCVKDWGGPGHGLFDVNGKPKPALAAYRAVTTSLEGAHYLGPWKGSEGVRGHLFQRAGQPILVLWTPASQGRVPVTLQAADGVPLVRTTANQERKEVSSAGKVTVLVSHAPVFVTGLKVPVIVPGRRSGAKDDAGQGQPVPMVTTPAPSTKSRAPTSNGEVWLSVVPPATTMRPYLVLGGYNELPVRVHNDGAVRSQVKLRYELQYGQELLAAGTLQVEVPPQTTSMAACRFTLPARQELAGQLALLRLRGEAGSKALAGLDLPVRLARSGAVEFLANSWTEKAYLHKSEKSGCSDSIRFGNEFGYRFDLRNVMSARLRLLVGANGAKDWSVLVSTDDQHYSQECSGKSWPSWQMISLDPYLAGAVREGPLLVYVKVRGTDCQAREVVLETAADTVPMKWGFYEKSPSELVVFDSRPELGMGMHGIDEKNIPLLRRLGIRCVRHTMYWNQIENTATPGQYDEKQLHKWDELVQLCQKEGIALVVVVHGNPPGVGWPRREEGYRRYARFLFDMARRYPLIRYWELWNEMDAGFTDLFGAGRSDVSLRDRGRFYAEMLKLTYPRIKQANPDAWVLTGGMTDANEFPRGIYEGGGRDFFDIMNLHTYGVPLEWAFSARGLTLRRIMAKYNDAGKPLWNTEYGIDAGNLVGAWGYPHNHKPAQKDGDYFDEEQRRQWEACLVKNRELGLYTKLFPYQFHAGNERDDDKQIRKRVQLPPGMTIDDYGFGIVRRDGLTPRPTYQWLVEKQWNGALKAEPTSEVDVRDRPSRKVVPVGYDYYWGGKDLIIRRVLVNSLFPTRIRLQEAR